MSTITACVWAPAGSDRAVALLKIRIIIIKKAVVRERERVEIINQGGQGVFYDFAVRFEP